jgi:hypothetical protein
MYKIGDDGAAIRSQRCNRKISEPNGSEYKSRVGTFLVLPRRQLAIVGVRLSCDKTKGTKWQSLSRPLTQPNRVLSGFWNVLSIEGTQNTAQAGKPDERIPRLDSTDARELLRTDCPRSQRWTLT